MNHPVVSVVTITYNQESYIGQAVEGALQQQTDFGVEIIIGEDCSTDRTREIVLGYQRKYPDRIQVITSNHNVGNRENFLRVLMASRGKYIAVCDGDDYWTDPHKLQKQVDFLETNPAYSLCCHDVELIFDGVPQTPKIARYLDFAKDTFSFEDAVRGHFIPTLSIVCRRASIMDPPDWYRECISGDIPLELLVLDKGAGYYLHETMGVKRDNPGSISLNRERATKADESFLRMYKSMDLYTEGRHQSVLRWRIARLSLKLAHESLNSGGFVRFFKYASDSFRYDRTAVCEAARRRLTWRRQGR
jgi:glycosyltransferase involved in cell wall biosynthesis